MRRTGLIILTAVLAFFGCTEQPERVITEPMGWHELKPARFSYTYQRSCFCSPEWVGPFSVRATADSVTEVYRLLYGEDSVPVTGGLKAYSIDSILAELYVQMGRERDTGFFEIDSVYRFVSHVYIDFSRHTADEEYGFTITNFRNLAD
jgi:hypothetical protein